MKIHSSFCSFKTLSLWMAIFFDKNGIKLCFVNFLIKIQAKFKHCGKSCENGSENLVKFGYNFAYEKND